MATIAIIGSGMMGSALAFPLSDNGHHVRLVGTPLDAAIISSLKAENYHPTLKFTMPEGVDTVEEQIDIARRKGGIDPDEDYKLQRFEVIRYR